jgi:uncharacterized membrane protein
MHMLDGEQDRAIQMISNLVKTNLNDEIYSSVMNFLQSNSSLLTTDSVIHLGRLFIGFRTNEPIRKFWNIFFDILLEKTSPQEVVQFFSDSMRENSNIPYNHLFKVILVPVVVANKSFFPIDCCFLLHSYSLKKTN